ncbi:MAG: aspartate kinase [Saprospiraceae bacterium]
MTNPTRVFKFGGASLRDPEAVRNVGSILHRYAKERLVIIVSAMGKTTDKLESIALAHAESRREDAVKLLEEIRRDHYAVAHELCGDRAPALITDLNDLIVSVEWVLEEEPENNYDYTYDQIVSVGELLSSRVVAAYLNTAELPTAWLDARDMVQTDNIFREGWVQWEETESRIQRMVPPLLDEGGFVLTQGFIGNTSENFTTTLGREGSDYTAAIFSYCLNAENMTIWKDVPGVLTADPRLFDNVVLLPRLSYKEAIEMTYYGARVIHPKTIKPLQNKSIPLHVRSFKEPTAEGTVINDEAEDTYPAMVAVENEQALVSISTRDFSFVAEQHIKELFSHITDLRLQVNMMQNTAISFNIVFNDTDKKVDTFAERIQDSFKTVIERGLELITVRHYTTETTDSLRRGRVVLVEEKMLKTLQMVVRTAPVLRRKEVLEFKEGE